MKFLEKARAFAAGYKTFAVGAFFILYYISTLLGIDPPAPGTEGEQIGGIGVLMIALRAITVGPAKLR